MEIFENLFSILSMHNGDYEDVGQTRLNRCSPPFEVIYIDSGSKELQHQYNVTLKVKKNTETNEEIGRIT